MNSIQNGQGGVPVFTPPDSQKSQGIPTFTPPGGAPVFTPPSTPNNGHVCYYHQHEPAVATCARCGKEICSDCFDNYGVSAGEFAGKALCYDCCQQLVSENVAELTKNKNTIKRQFILSCIGMAIGFILGLSSGISAGSFGAGLVYGIIYGLLGGVFLTALKAGFSMFWESIKVGFESGLISFFITLIIGSIVIFFKCIWLSISNTYHYIVYLKQTSGFIESDTAALQQMRDYMEYTQVRNRNRGVDVNTLLTQNSELANNSYARMVQAQGEQNAEAAMRQCVATINENGEIIRSFAA